MTISRRTLIAALGAIPAGGILVRSALAAYPERPIHLVVPFAAGGNADTVGRIVGDQMSHHLQQTVVVENRGGAGGAVGADVVARADADGYTLLVGSNGPLTINPVMHAKLSYDPAKDFAPVALAAYVPHALIVTNRFAAKNWNEVLSESKKKPISVATSGVGSASHFTLERLKAATGARMTHVPYRGGGAMMPDLIAGNVDAAVTEFSTALSLHKGAKGRIIAIAAASRSKLAPDLPTFDESGVKDFVAQSFIGILGPAATPKATIDKLQKSISAGLSGGEAPEKLRNLGSEIASPEQMTPEGFAAFLRKDAEDMRKAAKLAGIEPQ